MGTGTVRTAVVMALLGALFILPACKKQEGPMTGEQAREHVEEKLQEGFDASKKIVVAKVNGEAITQFSLLREMNALRPQYLMKAGQQQSPALDAKIWKDALDILITEELAVQEAGRQGLKPDPKKVDDALAKVRKEAGSAEAYQKYLSSNGLTEEELRRLIQRDALFEMIATREVDARIKVTDAELKALYERDKTGLLDSAHRQMSFAEARPMLEQKMRSEAAGKRMAQWEKELRKNARVEIVELKPQEGKKS